MELMTEVGRFVDETLPFSGRTFSGVHAGIRRGDNQLFVEVLFYPFSAAGLGKDIFLKRPESGEPDASEIVLLHFRLGCQFFRADIFRVQDRQTGEQDASETGGSRKHAEIIFQAAEKVTLNQFFTDGAFDPAKEQSDENGQEKVAGYISEEQAQAGVSGKEITQRLIEQSAENDNGEPLGDIEQFFGKAPFTASGEADDQNQNHEKIEPVNRQTFCHKSAFS
jgi:hypothetical protein